MIEQSTGAATVQTDAQPGTTYRIVVADGDHQLLSLLHDQLGALGHQVEGAAQRASSAIELAATVRPDLLLIDLELYDLDVDQLKTLIRQAPTVAVLGTSFAGCPVVTAAIAAGMHHHLSRPATLPQLAKAIDDAVAALRDRGTKS